MENQSFLSGFFSIRILLAFRHFNDTLLLIFLLPLLADFTYLFMYRDTVHYSRFIKLEAKEMFLFFYFFNRWVGFFYSDYSGLRCTKWPRSVCGRVQGWITWISIDHDSKCVLATARQPIRRFDQISCSDHRALCCWKTSALSQSHRTHFTLHFSSGSYQIPNSHKHFFSLVYIQCCVNIFSHHSFLHFKCCRLN